LVSRDEQLTRNSIPAEGSRSNVNAVLLLAGQLRWNIFHLSLRWAGHVARMGENRNEYRILVEKPDGKRPLGIPRRRWVDNI
jgi:hypothetical protein